MAAAKKTESKNGHFVTGPLVCVKDTQGAVQYLYRGAPVPEYVTGEVLDDLIAMGLVGGQDDLAAKPDPDAPPAPEPDGESS